MLKNNMKYEKMWYARLKMRKYSSSSVNSCEVKQKPTLKIFGIQKQIFQAGYYWFHFCNRLFVGPYNHQVDPIKGF